MHVTVVSLPPSGWKRKLTWCTNMCKCPDQVLSVYMKIRKIFLYYIPIFWETEFFLFSWAVSCNHQNENKKGLKYFTSCVMTIIYMNVSLAVLRYRKKKKKRLQNASVLESLYVYLWSSRFGHIFRRLKLITEPNCMNVFMTEVYVFYSFYHRNMSYRNHWNSRLPWYKCFVQVDGNFWSQLYIGCDTVYYSVYSLQRLT